MSTMSANEIDTTSLTSESEFEINMFRKAPIYTNPEIPHFAIS